MGIRFSDSLGIHWLQDQAAQQLYLSNAGGGPDVPMLAQNPGQHAATGGTSQVRTTPHGQANVPLQQGNTALPDASTTGQTPSAPNGTAPGTTSPAPGNNAPPATTPTNVQGTTIDAAMQTLNEWGMSSADAQAAITWYNNEQKAGTPPGQMYLNMYQQGWFQNNFPGIIEQIKAGQTPMTPQDYVAFEQNVLDFNRQFGIPDGAVSKADVGQMVGEGWTYADYTDRMGIAFSKSAQALVNNPQAQGLLDQWYGIKPGSGALAHFFLDPTKSQALLAQATTAAQGGASAQSAGLQGVDQGTLMALAANKSLGDIQSGIQSAVPLLATTRAGALSSSTVTSKDLLAMELGNVPGETQEQATQKVQVASNQRLQAVGGGGFQGIGTGGKPTAAGAGTQ